MVKSNLRRIRSVHHYLFTLDLKKCHILFIDITFTERMYRIAIFSVFCNIYIYFSFCLCIFYYFPSINFTLTNLPFILLLMPGCVERVPLPPLKNLNLVFSVLDAMPSN